MRALLIIGIVIAMLIGGILTLRSSRGVGMPNQDVLDRAKQRERTQREKDESDPDP